MSEFPPLDPRIAGRDRIPHVATAGIDGWVVEHPDGECVFCDAERWRKRNRLGR